MNTFDNDYGYNFGKYSPDFDLNKTAENECVFDVVHFLCNFLRILKENIIIYDMKQEKYLDVFKDTEINDKKLIVKRIGYKTENKETKIFILVRNEENNK